MRARRLMMAVMAMLLPLVASAEEINGIWYELSDKNATVIKGPKKYSGNVFIPNTVKYQGKEYKVTGIEVGAFSDCTEVVSLSIPKSVYYVGAHAFDGCTNVESLELDCQIIEDWFFDSHYLNNVILGDNVKKIGNKAFGNCKKLTSIVIPDGVEDISDFSFASSGLKSVTIGKGVTTISSYAFIQCELEDVYYLGSNPIVCCGITDLGRRNIILHVIGSVFELAKEKVSWYFKDIVVIEGTEIPDPYTVTYIVDGEVYKTVTYNEGDAITPEAEPTREGYTFSGWSWIPKKMPGEDVVVTGTFTKDPVKEKCEAPAIDYKDGRLVFFSKTEGAECVTTITSRDIDTHSGNEIEITATYDISTFARAEGYDDSDVVTATLCWVEAEGAKTAVNERIESNAVLIQGRDGTLWVTGAVNGTVEVYDAAGRMIAREKASEGTTQIETSLKSGDVAVVKIRNKAVKFVMQ